MAPSRAFGRIQPLLRHQATTSSPLRQRLRLYHSHTHPAPPGPFNAHESAILSAAYKHVPEHGFTAHALSLGARDAGYLDVSTNVLPQGPFSLILYHLVTQREALAPRRGEILGINGTDGAGAGASNGTGAVSVPENVERLTWARLLGNRDVNHRWQEALAIMAQPSHIPPSIHELALLSDEIHHLAGDASVDPTWYTKRGGLSMIYASCELFMTNDHSPQYTDTRAFLQRRLREGTSLSGAVGSVGQWLGFTASAGVNVLRSKGVRI
ncbi:ubiquinone biosynthesis protein COQ9 [Astrocystis sublimbata]|nr:ubiquinone biosynthesis protein COQ9 [Astrocystis sublimbata]